MEGHSNNVYHTQEANGERGSLTLSIAAYLLLVPGDLLEPNGSEQHGT